jgi:tetratricopeptide (TPR) repeat protein
MSHHSGMRSSASRWLIAVAALLLPYARAVAQSPPWEGLRPGPHTIGFRVIQLWDRGRTRLPPADFSGRRTVGDVAVPVQLAVWYPAVRSRSARPMTLLELRLVAVHDAENGRIDARERFAAPVAADSAAAISDAMRVMRRVSDADTLRAETQPDVVVSRPLASYRDAAPSPGRFPVAVIEGDASISNTSVLAEYLATHGWIVIVTSSRTAASMPLEASEPRIPVEMGVRGIEHGVSAALALPGADPSRLVIVGVNFAGLAALEYQMRYMRAAAVVTINGSETIDDRARVLRASPWFDAARIRVPVLNVHMDQPGAPPANRGYLEALGYADRLSLVVKGLDHSGLIGNPLVFPTATPARRAGYAYLIRAIHATIARAVGETIDDFLARSPEVEGFPADIVMELWRRPALPAIPTRAEFAEILWDRRDIATATRLFRDARSRDSTVRLFTEIDMGVYAFRYQRLGRVDDALAVHRLTLEAYPDSYRARNDIGALLLARGDTAGAVREFELALDLLARTTTVSADEKAVQERAWRARVDRLRRR